MSITFFKFLKTKKLAYHLLTAFLLILFWLFSARSQYQYNYNFWKIFGVSLFTLFSASVGLFLIYVIFSWFEYRFKLDKLAAKFFIFTAIAWVILIILETVGYHLFGIHNIRTAQYSGLPICDCIHAPFWMQLAYFLMGPVYFAICSLLKLENNNKNYVG